MNVHIENNDPFGNALTVTDLNNSDAIIWSGRIEPHQTITVSCQSNDSGFGHIQTNADGVIVKRSFLKEGETVQL